MSDTAIEMRRACAEDIPRILAITGQARAFQRASGFVQWQDNYPARANIAADIAAGGAYVFCLAGEIIAYAYLCVGDSEYDRLTDTWQCDAPYGVVHRLAVSSDCQGKGLSATFFALIEQHFIRSDIHTVRIDTGEENVVMQRIMHRNGYVCRGVRQFVWGVRLAYEKSLR